MAEIEGRMASLVCTVSQPQKEYAGSKDSVYISYLVSTKTNMLVNFQKTDFSVRRRFTDFEFLHNRLSKLYFGHLIPPLPSKTVGQRLDGDFVKQRCHALHRFIRRISLHPTLRSSQVLHDFLSSSDWGSVMAAVRKRKQSSASANPDGTASPDTPGFFDNITDAMMNAWVYPQTIDPDFVDIQSDAAHLESTMNSMGAIVSKVSKCEVSLVSDHENLSKQLGSLMELEENLKPELTLFSDGLEKMGVQLKELQDHTALDYKGSLKDMEAYARRIHKNLLSEREKKQLDYEQLDGYLQRSSNELSTALASPHRVPPTPNPLTKPHLYVKSKVGQVRGVPANETREERIHALTEEVDTLKTELEKARLTSEAFNKRVISEVEIFADIQSAEFKDSLGALADAHIRFFDQAKDIWTTFIDDLKNVEARPKAGPSQTAAVTSASAGAGASTTNTTAGAADRAAESSAHARRASSNLGLKVSPADVWSSGRVQTEESPSRDGSPDGSYSFSPARSGRGRKNSELGGGAGAGFGFGNDEFGNSSYIFNPSGRRSSSSGRAGPAGHVQPHQQAQHQVQPPHPHPHPHHHQHQHHNRSDSDASYYREDAYANPFQSAYQHQRDRETLDRDSPEEDMYDEEYLSQDEGGRQSSSGFRY